MTKDPVCNMEIDEEKAVAVLVYKGQTYHFCSSKCKESFEKEPEKYA